MINHLPSNCCFLYMKQLMSYWSCFISAFPATSYTNFNVQSLSGDCYKKSQLINGFIALFFKWTTKKHLGKSSNQIKCVWKWGYFRRFGLFSTQKHPKNKYFQKLKQKVKICACVWTDVTGVLSVATSLSNKKCSNITLMVRCRWGVF